MKQLLSSVFLLIATLAHAQAADPPVSYVIAGDAFQPPSTKDQAAILAALCDGTVEKNTCNTCPQSSVAETGFTLRRVISGHFLGSQSTDAFVTIFGCEEMHASIGWGFLVTKRADTWEPAAEVLGLELDHCHRMAFRSGREFLVCEDYRMESFQLMHSVYAVIAKEKKITFRNLLTAADTTRECDEQPRVQKAQIDKIDFGNQISLTASIGTMPDSPRRRKQCQDIEDNISKAPRPTPTVMKTYRIDYQFDGRQFKLTQESEPAAKLFHWE